MGNAKRYKCPRRSWNGVSGDGLVFFHLLVECSVCWKYTAMTEVAPLQQQIDECEAFEFGPYRLIPSERILLAGQNRVEIGSRAFDILALLLRHRGEVVSRRQILNAGVAKPYYRRGKSSRTNERPSSRVELRRRKLRLHKECARTRICVRCPSRMCLFI